MIKRSFIFTLIFCCFFAAQKSRAQADDVNLNPYRLFRLDPKDDDPDYPVDPKITLAKTLAEARHSALVDTPEEHVEEWIGQLNADLPSTRSEARSSLIKTARHDTLKTVLAHLKAGKDLPETQNSLFYIGKYLFWAFEASSYGFLPSLETNEGRQPRALVFKTYFKKEENTEILADDRMRSFGTVSDIEGHWEDFLDAYYTASKSEAKAIDVELSRDPCIHSDRPPMKISLKARALEDRELRLILQIENDNVFLVGPTFCWFCAFDTYRTLMPDAADAYTGIYRRWLKKQGVHLGSD